MEARQTVTHCSPPPPLPSSQDGGRVEWVAVAGEVLASGGRPLAGPGDKGGRGPLSSTQRPYLHFATGPHLHSSQICLREVRHTCLHHSCNTNSQTFSLLSLTTTSSVTGAVSFHCVWSTHNYEDVELIECLLPGEHMVCFVLFLLELVRLIGWLAVFFFLPAQLPVRHRATALYSS